MTIDEYRKTKIEMAAKTAHNVNTAFCEVYGHPHCGN